MSKKWVTVIPGSKEVIPTIHELKKLGYKVACIDQSPEAVAFKECDLPLISPLTDFEKILYLLKAEEISPECFIPVVSDKAILPAYMLNMLFNRGRKNENILAFYSKSVLRNTLSKSKLPTPGYAVLSDKKELSKTKIAAKLILKPDDSSGSRGISILESPSKKKLEEAFDFAMGFSANKKVIVEEYIAGEEYMIDCFIDAHKVKALLVSQKKKIEDKVSYLIYTLNSGEFPYKKLNGFIEKLTKVLDYEKGPMHIEIKYVKGVFYILDLAARGGGFGVYNYYVHKALNFNFVRSTIDVFLNKKLSQKSTHYREGLIFFLTPEKEGTIDSITSTYSATKNEDVRIDFYHKKGQKVTTEVNDGNRLAGIYCFADTKEELNALLEKVKKSITINYKK